MVRSNHVSKRATDDKLLHEAMMINIGDVILRVWATMSQDKILYFSNDTTICQISGYSSKLFRRYILDYIVSNMWEHDCCRVGEAGDLRRHRANYDVSILCYIAPNM